ncbi:hypothetical protein M8J76_009143 [Diaphorina citri]|nr:hypothetical protein M8J75_003103 [Diaphorina citri]KAI5722489.1 hypothetical protein M8J76_009143 [Diaphorina citri]
MDSANAITSQTSLYVKPSIFDLVAQDSMSELIQPAFKKVIYYLSLKNPEKYGWMSKWVDECFLGFNILIQRFCLTQCGASFSEFMYKLQRVPLQGNSSLQSARLPLKQEMLSLVCLTLIPHVRNKLDDYLQTQSETSQLSKLFRSALFLSSLSRLVHHLLYLTNRIESHSPLLTLCGVRLTYVQDEHVNTNRFLSALSSLVQVGALSVQLLQTWYSNSGDDVTLTGNGVALGIPPPPGAHLSLPGSGCPLCRGRCKIPTVLATSGYVFCFKCIAERLKSSHQCPLTGIPSSIDDLIQVYSAPAS